MNVADIHQQDTATGGWILFIEGCGVAFTSIPALEGSGSGSWIGEGYGAREILDGLLVPDLPFGETRPDQADIAEQRATFTILDHDGRVAELFAEEYPEQTSDSMGTRLAPSADPAPEFVAGPAETPVGLWGRHVGTEAIGPEGERRYFWIEPAGAPPGLDHVAGEGWPPTLVTDEPRVWAGRLVAVYRVVKDPDTGTWPSWTDQHEGGSLWWIGRIKGRGTFSSSANAGRAFALPAVSVAGLLRKPANLLRPTVWAKPIGGVTLSGDELKVAAWIGLLGGVQVEDGIAAIPSTYDAQTLASGNTLAGLNTREEIWQKIRDTVYTMIRGSDTGTVLASSNAGYTGPTPPIDQQYWQFGTLDRDVWISPDGSTIKIKCEADSGASDGYYLGLAIDARVAQLAGWDINAPGWSSAKDMAYWCPVGGSLWGGNNEDAILPPYHVVARFETRVNPEDPPGLWENGGHWTERVAPYQVGTVTLDPDGGDVLRLAVGEWRTEGQYGAPYTYGSQIDGVDVDTTGWWVFRGKRITVAAYLAGDAEPEEYVAIALCEWVATSTGDAVEVDADGSAAIKVVRWEDPRRFGLDYDRMTEPWVSLLGGLECAPLAVLGGIHPHAPDWRHRLIPRLLLSSGTCSWTENGTDVEISPGANHPPDAPANDPWGGDVEVADLGLGLPHQWVDWQSWYSCAAALPGGPGGALNRVTYSSIGPLQVEELLKSTMGGVGWAWSWRRDGGAGPLRLGCWDPLRVLGPEDVEVTIGRAFVAEGDSPGQATGPQWRSVIELRDVGPFDRFTFSVDGSPLENSLAYSLAHESLDPGRRYRDGKIEWDIKDPGLRDPAPWVGTPAKVLYDWTEQARVRFAAGFGPAYARPGRVWRQVLDATWITRIGIGTVVRVIDSTAEAPDGTRGIDHIGRVIDATIVQARTSQGHATSIPSGIRVSVLLQRAFAEVRGWGPYAVAGVGSWDSGSSTLTVEEDSAGVGGGHVDTRGFVQPEGDGNAPGSMRVEVHQSHDGVTYPAGLVASADVVSVDSGTPSLALANISGQILRDTIKRVVAAPWADQTAEWVLARFKPVTEPTGLLDSEKMWRL